MRKFQLIISLLAASLSITVNAQTYNEPFDKVKMSTMLMNQYPEDSTASAVILYRKGEFEPNQFQFTYSMRIKILTKEGFDIANFVVHAERKTYIKGVTYNLENGKIVKEKLDKKNIFKEDVVDNEYTRFRFGLPSIKEGSVIDVKYTIVGFPSTFEFQKRNPVDYAELIVPQSQYIKFKQYAMGFHLINKKSDIHWYSEKIPALKKEPFTSSLENYITQFQFDILRISYPGYPYKSVASDWNSVANYLRKNEEFGSRLNTTCMFLNEKAKEIVAKDTSNHAKMVAAYEYIKNHMTWNEGKDVMAEKDLRYVFNEGEGSVSEINLMLVKMMEKVGLKSYPIVGSTRNNGYLHPFFASLEKLNYVLAGVEIGKKVFTLDATNKLIPAGLLPNHIYNGQARFIKENETGPITIVPKSYETHTTYNLDLDADGTFKGTITEVYKNNAAYDFRKDYHSLGDNEEFIKERASDNAGLQINNIEIKNLDDIYKDIEITMEVVINNQTQMVGDEIYFNPMLFEKIEKNPFQKETRNYPIDFTYPRQNNYYLMLNLPEGYSVKTSPKPAITRLPENGGQYFYNINNMGSRIQLSFMKKLSNAVYVDAFYPYLKEFYRRVVEKNNEFVVLTKETNE